MKRTLFFEIGTCSKLRPKCLKTHNLKVLLQNNNNIHGLGKKIGVDFIAIIIIVARFS